MATYPKIVSARRSYEFLPTELRLTMLSLEDIRRRIQEHFEFDVNEIQMPPAVFGQVQPTVPPGIVFQVGVVQLSTSERAPVRFLHFEPNRIVIDVAGSSSFIDGVFNQLSELLATAYLPDGSPSIGDIARILDYSEVSYQLGFAPEQLISSPLQLHAGTLFSKQGQSTNVVPAGIRFISPHESGDVEKSDVYTLEIANLEQPDSGVYRSIADLPTDEHLAWLKTLSEELSKPETK